MQLQTATLPRRVPLRPAREYAGLILLATADGALGDWLSEEIARHTAEVEVIALEKPEALLPLARDEQRRPDLVLLDARAGALPRNRLMQALHVRLKLRRVPVICLKKEEGPAPRELFTQTIHDLDEKRVQRLVRDYLRRHLSGATRLDS